MPINIATMRKQLRTTLGVDEDELSDDDVDLYLNQSYWEILSTYPFREKEKTATFLTVAGERNYDMPTPFEALRQLSVKDIDGGQHNKLKQVTISDSENNYNENDTARGQPTMYVREGCLARLLPTPDKAYVVIMKYWTTLADLSDDNDAEIPQEWHEIIMLGGVWRAALYFSGDITRSNAFIAVQAKLINEKVPVQAKEEIDNRDAGLEVKGLVRDY